MRLYLENVISGKYRYNHHIIQNFQVSTNLRSHYFTNQFTYPKQDIFNLLPNLQIDEMIKAFSVKSNDYMYVLYVSSMIKSVISLHQLINNKVQYKETEIEEQQKAKEAEEEKKRLEEERKKLEEERKKKKEAEKAKEKDAKDA